MNKDQIKGNLMLLIAAFIWGSAFVAQSVGMELIGPFTFNATRSFIGTFVLIPTIMFFDHAAGRKLSFWGTDDPAARKTLLTGGVLCGLILAFGSNLQQAGLAQTSVGKAGFITALYIVIVPLVGFFTKKRAGWLLWVSVFIALAGMYFLCLTESLTIGMGDLLLLVSALFFTGHIVTIDHFTSAVDGVRMCCMQFFISGCISSVLMFLFETPTVPAILASWPSLLYAGVLSSGVAFTFQILGQRGTNPTVASLIMSLESVFAAISGWLILGEQLSSREIFGCALVFIAIILAQIPKTRKAVA